MSVRDQLHAIAVAASQQGRYPEACGRFMKLADGGHVPSAEVALLIFQYSTTLFHSDWDASQAQLTAWSALIHWPAPVLQRGVYPRARSLAAVALC